MKKQFSLNWQFALHSDVWNNDFQALQDPESLVLFSLLLLLKQVLVLKLDSGLVYVLCIIMLHSLYMFHVYSFVYIEYYILKYLKIKLLHATETWE